MKCIKYLVFLCLLVTTLSRAQVAVYGKVEHIVPDGVDTLGNITLTVSGSTAPYTYTWNPGAINTKDISNITAGQYTVNVKSASSQTLNCYYNMGYKALWTNLNNAVSRNDSVISNAPNTNVYGTAVSKNTLLAGTDGWFEIVMNNVTTTNRFFIGLVDQVSPYTRYDEINYGLYYTTAKQLYCFERSVGTFILNATPKVGDVVRVERLGDTIKYKINNATVRTVTVTGISSKNYKLKVALQAVTQVANVGCSFANLSNNSFPGYITVIPTIKHSSDLGASDGSIMVVPKVPFTNTYTWSPGTSTTQTTSSLTAGTSTLTIADSLLNSSIIKFNVGYKVLWTNTDRCFSRNDSLVSTSTTASVYGTAISKNTLPANTDGWIEYVINEFGANNQYIGFTQSASPIQYTGADMDYVIYYFAANKTLYYYETGTTNIINYNANVGDVIRIERVDSTIIYRINGISFRSITVPGLQQKPLKIKAQMAGPNRIVNVGCSFYNKSNAVWNDYVQVYPLIKHNSDIGTSDGSIKLTPKIPFTNTYSWTPGGATTASVSALSPGNYSVTVKDSLLNQSPYNYNVGYKVRWTNMERCIFRNDSLFSTINNVNTYATATSKNTLEANTDGWFEYVFDASAANNAFIGFLDSVMQFPYASLDLDYGILCSGTSLSYYENGGATTAVMTSHLRVGDIIRVQRVGDVISYKVNGYNYRSITVAGISQKVWKIKSNLVSLGRFVNVGCSFIKMDNVDFANFVQISAKVTHNTALGNNDGVIKVTPRIPFSNTYSWLPGGATTSSITNVPIGTSTVTIADSLNNKSRFKINMGYKPNWTGLSNALISGDTLKGNVTTNASAYTKDTLLPYTDGWVEYVYSEPTAKSFYFGFLDAVGSPTVATDIDYGFYFNGSTVLNTFSGSTVTAWTYNFKQGDVIKMARYGDTIRYSLNGRLSRVVVATGISSKAYRVKAVLVNKAKLIDLGLSFTLCRATISAGSTQTITCTTPSVVLTGTTNLSGASYTWSPGGITTSTASVSSPGTYSLLVKNSSGECAWQSTVAVAEPFSASVGIDNYQNDTVPGEVELCVKGGTLPYDIIWNGQRVPSYDTVYSMIIASGVTLPIDTVRLKHDLDSIRTVTKHTHLDPGLYPATVYTADNDSLKTINVVGGNIAWALSKGVNFVSAQVPEFQMGNDRYVYGSGENLTQTGSYYLGESIAYAANVISKDYNNYIRFSVPNLSDTVHVGLTFRKAQLDSIPDDSVAIARMAFKGSNVKVKFAGSVLYNGSRNSSDVFTISNDTVTGKISFYQNSTLLAQANFINAFRGVGALSEDVLLVAVGLGKAGAVLNNLVIISNPKYLQNRVEGTITDATCGNLCSGQIDASGISTDNVVPVKYEIIDVTTNTVFSTINYTSGANHALFTGLCAGKYKIKYYAEKSQYTFGGTPIMSTVIYQKTFEIAYMPDWVNNTGVTISSTDRSLTKSSGAVYNWDAGASSLNTLLAGQSGWIEWSPSLETEINGIGFSTSDADLDIATINYGIGYIRIDLGLWGTWRYYVKTNNSTMIASLNPPNSNVLQPYTQNDRFRLEKNGSNISLSLNGTPINQFVGVSTSTPYILDASLKFFGGTILHPRISFGCPEVAKQYAVLKSSMDGHYYELSGNNLRFTLDGEYTLGYLKYKVFNNQQIVVASDYYNTSLLSPANLKPGDNRYTLNCNSFPAGYYTLEVTNEKNEKQYLRFKR